MTSDGAHTGVAVDAAGPDPGATAGDDVTPGAHGTAGDRRPGPASRALRLAVRHAGLIVLVVLAGIARAVVTSAYSTALWFPDSGTYVDRAASLEPAVDRPWGYSAFLRALDPVTDFRQVAIVQHVLGVAVIVLLYALLQRRGVSRWASLLAVVPLAFDGYLLDIEHFILAETLFVVLLTVAVVLLLGKQRPGAVVAAVVGVLLGALTLTRTVGLFLVGVVLVYLLVRLLLRTLRWTALVAFVIGVAATLVPYAAWFDSHHGTFALTDYTGHFLYGRVSEFVECDRIDVPERLRPLCPTDPPEERRPGDQFVWFADSPANEVRDGVRVWSEADLEEFATTAIEQQPWDYAREILTETVHYLAPGRTFGPQDTCPTWWVFPSPSPVELYNCTPLLAPGPFGYDARLTAQLRSYQRYFYTPGPVLALGVVAGLGALLRRRRSWADRLDPALLAVLGLALLAGPAATASFDYRYALPALAVLPPAAALGMRGLSLRRRRRPRAPADTADRPEPATSPG